MKLLEVLIFSFFTSFLISLVSCEVTKDQSTPMPIFKRLPIIYYGCNLQALETIIIRNQFTFDSTFDPGLVVKTPSLQNIDLNKYDVLVGADVYTHGIDSLGFKLEKLNNLEYNFNIWVYYLLTLPAGNFYYGIIVDKLPADSKVNFILKKLNEK